MSRRSIVVAMDGVRGKMKNCMLVRAASCYALSSSEWIIIHRPPERVSLGDGSEKARRISILTLCILPFLIKSLKIHQFLAPEISSTSFCCLSEYKWWWSRRRQSAVCVCVCKGERLSTKLAFCKPTSSIKFLPPNRNNKFRMIQPRGRRATREWVISTTFPSGLNIVARINCIRKETFRQKMQIENFARKAEFHKANGLNCSPNASRYREKAKPLRPMLMSTPARSRACNCLATENWENQMIDEQIHFNRAKPDDSDRTEFKNLVMSRPLKFSFSFGMKQQKPHSWRLRESENLWF